MNQNIPPIARLAPPVLIGVAIYSLLKHLFFDQSKEANPASTPAKNEAENNRKITGNLVFRSFSPEISHKPTTEPVSAVFPSASQSALTPASSAPVRANSAPAAPKIPVTPPPIAAAKTPAGISPPAQKKFITRADMERIFSGNARRLTRKTAVSALKASGFGKTAAYAALSPDGRFSAWLQCAPDGIISWKSG